MTIKDLFMDTGTKELSHMEMVATTINLLNGYAVDYIIKSRKME